jgi:hypothetical protein
MMKGASTNQAVLFKSKLKSKSLFIQEIKDYVERKLTRTPLSCAVSDSGSFACDAPGREDRYK